MQVRHHLSNMLEPIIEELGYECVRIMTIGQVNPTLQIMIDKTDGTEINVEDCAKVSRALSAILDENDPIKDKYNLEVSSPGLDRPLTKLEHFIRFAGNEVKIETDETIEGRKRFKGLLTGVKETKIILNMDDKVFEIPFDAVSKAKIILTDELLAKWEAEHLIIDEITE